MTPADQLRTAAHHILDRAAEATPGPWHQEHDGSVIVHGPERTVAETIYEAADATHIALWDPTVAELVAAMLIAIAADWTTLDRYNTETSNGRDSPDSPETGWREALAIAQAINAEEARNA